MASKVLAVRDRAEASDLQQFGDCVSLVKAVLQQQPSAHMEVSGRCGNDGSEVV